MVVFNTVNLKNSFTLKVKNYRKLLKVYINQALEFVIKDAQSYLQK